MTKLEQKFIEENKQLHEVVKRIADLEMLDYKTRFRIQTLLIDEVMKARKASKEGLN